MVERMGRGVDGGESGEGVGWWREWGGGMTAMDKGGE